MGWFRHGRPSVTVRWARIVAVFAVLLLTIGLTVSPTAVASPAAAHPESGRVGKQISAPDIRCAADLACAAEQRLAARAAFSSTGDLQHHHHRAASRDELDVDRPCHAGHRRFGFSGTTAVLQIPLPD